MTTTSDPEFDNPGVGDFFGDEKNDPYERPERTEDRVPRDSWQKPRILPLGMAMPKEPEKRNKVLRSYFRPSGFGELLEDHYKLERWERRMAVDGMLSDKRLRLDWANAGPEVGPDGTKDRAAIDKRDEILAEAKQRARANDKADEGTAVHALTERHDLGLPINHLPEEYAPDLAEWVRLTQHLEIRGVECFVVEDTYRCAGTFDRLVYYHIPCRNCGKHLRILDLKTGAQDKVAYGGMKMACQLALYAHSQFYDPATGERYSLGDVCMCRGIIVDLPAGTGKGQLRYLNIAQGWNDVVRLSAEVRRLRRKDNWWLPLETVPDIMSLIAAAKSRQELNALHTQFRAIWRPEHTEAGHWVAARLDGEK